MYINLFYFENTAEPFSSSPTFNEVNQFPMLQNLSDETLKTPQESGIESGLLEKCRKKSLTFPRSKQVVPMELRRGCDSRVLI